MNSTCFWCQHMKRSIYFSTLSINVLLPENKDNSPFVSPWVLLNFFLSPETLLVCWVLFSSLEDCVHCHPWVITQYSVIQLVWEGSSVPLPAPLSSWWEDSHWKKVYCVFKHIPVPDHRCNKWTCQYYTSLKIQIYSNHLTNSTVQRFKKTNTWDSLEEWLSC